MAEIEENENQNTEYEILTQEIYKSLLKADGFENINVQHNVKIPAKSGCNHQVDVYWEFKLAGETHKVAIECKNYSKEVSIAKVRDFFGVVYDIGNIKGIFITKKGFQSGAKQFADYYGISLKELREPNTEDWKGRIKTIQVDINVMPTVVTGIYVEPDFAWVIAKGFIKSEDERNLIIMETNKLNTEICVYDKDGGIIDNFLDLEQKLPHEFKEGKDFKHAYKYDDGYMESNFGKIKVNFVGFKYDIKNVSSQLVIEAEQITKAIIKDVKTGEIKFISKDGDVK